MADAEENKAPVGAETISPVGAPDQVKMPRDGEAEQKLSGGPVNSKAQIWGSVAQWVSACATVAVVILAALGYQAASVILDVEERKKEVQRKAAEIANLSESKRYVSHWAACLAMDSKGTDFLNDLVNGTKRISAVIVGGTVPPPGLKIVEYKVVDLAPRMFEPAFSILEEPHHSRVAHEWREVSAKFGDKLDLVVLPAFTDTMRPSLEEFERAHQAFSVAEDYKAVLFDACERSFMSLPKPQSKDHPSFTK